MKLDRILCVLGAVLLVWSGISPAYAAEAAVRSSDDVLVDALPEKAMPQLQEILTKAMRNAPRVIAAGLDLEQSDTSVKMARAPMLPNASISGGYGFTLNRYDYSSYWDPKIKDTAGATVGGTVAGHTSEGVQQALSYSGGIGQPIYHWGALKKGYQSAQLLRAITERNVGEIRRALATEIRRAYFNLIIATNGRESDRVTLANLEKERDFFKEQQAAGFVTGSVVGSVESRIQGLNLQMRRTDSSYEAQWAAFRQLTGIEELPSSMALPKEIPAISRDLAPALQGLSLHPDDYVPVGLLNADDSIHAERLNYEIVSTRLRPKLGLSLYASRGYNTPNNLELYGGPYVLTSYGISTSVNWNIFDGFSTRAAKQSSMIRMRQLKSSREQTERDYQETIKTYVANLRFNWETLQLTETALVGYRSTVETFQKDYEAGFATKKAWDDAKILAENGLQAANNARADYYMQIVNYLSLRGKDTAVVAAPKH